MNELCEYDFDDLTNLLIKSAEKMEIKLNF